MPETIEELRHTLNLANEHTEMLMKRIEELATQLKAAEYAAKFNYDGWQQEIARSGERAADDDGE